MPTVDDAPFSDQSVRVDFVEAFWPTHKLAKQVLYVLGSTAPFQLYIGGIRSGKTWALTLKELMLCITHPGVNGMLAGRTGRDNATTLMPQFMDHCDTWRRAVGYTPYRRYHRGDKRVEFWNGSSLYFRPYDQPDKLRGITLGHAGLDEIDYGSQPAYTWDVVAGRMSDARVGKGKCLHGATTPNGLRGVAGKFVRMQASEAFVAFHTTIYDNPFLTSSFIEDLRMSYSPRAWEQEGLGKILRPRDVIFTEYSEARHLVDWTWRRDLPWVLGVDWGTSAAAAVAIQVLPDGTWVIADELVVQDTSYVRFRAQLAAWIESKPNRPVLAVSDRAVKSEKLWLAAKYAHQCEVTSCKTKRDQSLIRGIEMLRFMLDPPFERGHPFLVDPDAPPERPRPKLLVSSSLASNPTQSEGPLGTRDALNTYTYRRGPFGELTNDPSDAPDDPAKHILDTIRMAAVMSAWRSELHGGQPSRFVWEDRRAA